MTSTINEKTFTPIDPLLYRPIIARALEEDLGLAGDITSTAIIAPDARAEIRLSARQTGRIAGLPIAQDVFRYLDPDIHIEAACGEGEDVEAGTTVAVLNGLTRCILTGERTALNIITRLSGIATATRRAVEAIHPYPTRVSCTRKTTPGLRVLEKYDVRVGGGINHRFGLFDGILIKDNHVAAAGGIQQAIERARVACGHMVKIEAEVDNLAQVTEALDAGVDAVLLDNMTPDQVRDAVRLIDGRIATEASGGLRPDTIRDYAAAGVDIVSLGWLTHSVPGLDFGLDF